MPDRLKVLLGPLALLIAEVSPALLARVAPKLMLTALLGLLADIWSWSHFLLLKSAKGPACASSFHSPPFLPRAFAVR